MNIDRHKRIILYALLMVATILCGTACDDRVESPLPNCEVVVNVRVVASSVATKALPDPGVGHGEDYADWDRLVLYFVYDNGMIIDHPMSRAQYEQGIPHVDEPEGVDEMDFSISVLSGKIRSIYAIAYGDPQEDVGICRSLSNIRNLKTLSLNDYSKFNNSPSERKRYMNSLFSGSTKYADGVEISEDAVEAAHISVTLYRLIAKVDVQYDVQGAYDNGGYTEAVMSEITFSGVSQGWFFPNEAPEESETVMELAKIEAHKISGRNGRAYFYVLPSRTAGNEKLEFSITYTKGDGNTGALEGGTYPYVITFNESLLPASWQWLRFDVKGDHVGATTGGNNITLTVPGN